MISTSRLTRFSAAAIHLGGSVLIGAAIFSMLWFVLYPAPLFAAMGGMNVFLMLLFVDVCLGPLLTFVVFKPGKRGLYFDLTLIAVIQFAAMAYGAHILYIGRPVYVAALGHRFDIVPANEVKDESLVAAGQTLPRFGPVWTGVREATDPVEKEKILFSAFGGADYGHFPKYHAPLETMREIILKESADIAKLKALNPTQLAEIDRWLVDHGYNPDQVKFQGLKAREQDMTVFVDAQTAKVVGIAPFRPWE